MILLFSIAVGGEGNAQNGYGVCRSRLNGEELFIKDYVKDSYVVFDVGANIGSWTAIVKKYARKAEIFAFEPYPKVFRILQRASRRYENIQLFNFALSREDGEGILFTWDTANSLRQSGLNGLYYRPLLKKRKHRDPKEVLVKKTTLDLFCSEYNISHIDLLKIDTEGSEWDVLLGAHQMIINNHISAIQFEYGGCYTDSETTLKEIYVFLTDNDYKIFRLSSIGLIPEEKWKDELENYKYSNWVALKQVDESEKDARYKNLTYNFQDN
ncbi:MAG: FkbM family methyltransferase [Simkaniaceae bacterium]